MLHHRRLCRRHWAAVAAVEDTARWTKKGSMAAAAGADAGECDDAQQEGERGRRE